MCELRKLFTFEDFMLFQKMMHEKNLAVEVEQYAAQKYDDASYNPSSSTANWACSTCTWMNAPMTTQCEHCQSSKSGSHSFQQNTSSVASNSTHEYRSTSYHDSHATFHPDTSDDLAKAIRESKKVASIQKRQNDREARALAMAVVTTEGAQQRRRTRKL